MSIDTKISSQNSCRNSDEYLGGRYNVIVNTNNSALSSRARYSNNVNSLRSMSLYPNCVEKMASIPSPFLFYLTNKNDKGLLVFQQKTNETPYLHNSHKL